MEDLQRQLSNLGGVLPRIVDEILERGGLEALVEAAREREDWFCAAGAVRGLWRTRCPYDDRVTARRTLGPGPEAPAHSIRAAQADLLDALPGVRLPDVDELRDRGVLGPLLATSPSPSPRRTLGAAGRADEDPPQPA
ncbi:MAG: hypothetical protein LBV60_19395 [Streptomyces sp.]|nr:hypothetical protein [Streptomyces sp.]